MLKGFISFGEGKIPFVVEDYRMELFTDDDLLEEFTKEKPDDELIDLKGFVNTILTHITNGNKNEERLVDLKNYIPGRAIYRRHMLSALLYYIYACSTR